MARVPAGATLAVAAFALGELNARRHVHQRLLTERALEHAQEVNLPLRPDFPQDRDVRLESNRRAGSRASQSQSAFGPGRLAIVRGGIDAPRRRERHGDLESFETAVLCDDLAGRAICSEAVSLSRTVEMYAWHRESQTEEDKKKNRPVAFTSSWTQSPQDTQDGAHRNPAMPFRSHTFRAPFVRLTGSKEEDRFLPSGGVWLEKKFLRDEVDAMAQPMQLAWSSPLEMGARTASSTGSRKNQIMLPVDDRSWFSSPTVGDVRVTYHHVPVGLEMTAAGELHRKPSPIGPPSDPSPEEEEQGALWLRPLKLRISQSLESMGPIEIPEEWQQYGIRAVPPGLIAKVEKWLLSVAPLHIFAGMPGIVGKESLRAELERRDMTTYLVVAALSVLGVGFGFGMTATVVSRVGAQAAFGTGIGLGLDEVWRAHKAAEEVIERNSS
jgi:Transmembrane protein 43